MRDADEGFGVCLVGLLLDEPRLQAWESVDGLGQQIDRFVDDQEPGVVDQDFDGFGIGHLGNR
jgi:hypothetical protein